MNATKRITIQPFNARHRQRCYEIFNELDGWFGSEEINTDYTEQLNENDTLLAFVDEGVEGVISLQWHYDTTAEIYSMAVSLAHHRFGLGKQLLAAAESLARERGYKFLHVKTLGDTLPHPGYQKTRAFYENRGFNKLFQTHDLWDGLPTLLYVKALD
ncbi:GNAT family N-acetyltransferase [Saccharospirillum mangrovi]|uniref:GNAT family N-acetyltransferase n=1 Tax=Saccharospirillum mangrovi TaxID=2161747 RepID=UPI000D38C247|nr:GNAT family N-acetyltransferase [Saccharospirillum mangrovi]